MSTSPSSEPVPDLPRPDAETTQELLARLPTLPKVAKPIFGSAEHLEAQVHDPADLADVESMVSGGYLDDLLAEVRAAVPSLATADFGRAGLQLRARLSNSINALTLPTADGVVMVYNLGLFGLQYSVALAVAAEALTANTAADAEWAPSELTVAWLSLVVDWSTSRAGEPRHGPLARPDRDLPVDDDIESMATNIAGPSQRFALCHELGHALDLLEERTPGATVPMQVGPATVAALATSHEREFAADLAGFDLLLDCLDHQGRARVGALIGVELFLNTVGMMQPFVDATERGSHPDPDERLSRMRQHYLDRFGPSAETIGPAIALRAILESLRRAVVPAVIARRARVTSALHQEVASYLAVVDGLDQDGRRRAARGIAEHLLASPGATLDFLHDGLMAPLEADEPDSGSPARLLLYNAALHLEAPLRTAVGLRA